MIHSNSFAISDEFSGRTSKSLVKANSMANLALTRMQRPHVSMSSLATMIMKKPKTAPSSDSKGKIKLTPLDSQTITRSKIPKSVKLTKPTPLMAFAPMKSPSKQILQPLASPETTDVGVSESTALFWARNPDLDPRRHASIINNTEFYRRPPVVPAGLERAVWHDVNNALGNMNSKSLQLPPPPQLLFAQKLSNIQSELHAVVKLQIIWRKYAVRKRHWAARVIQRYFRRIVRNRWISQLFRSNLQYNRRRWGFYMWRACTVQRLIAEDMFVGQQRFHQFQYLQAFRQGLDEQRRNVTIVLASFIKRRQYLSRLRCFKTFALFPRFGKMRYKHLMKAGSPWALSWFKRAHAVTKAMPQMQRVVRGGMTRIKLKRWLAAAIPAAGLIQRWIRGEFARERVRQIRQKNAATFVQKHIRRALALMLSKQIKAEGLRHEKSRQIDEHIFVIERSMVTVKGAVRVVNEDKKKLQQKTKGAWKNRRKELMQAWKTRGNDKHALSKQAFMAWSNGSAVITPALALNALTQLGHGKHMKLVDAEDAAKLMSRDGMFSESNFCKWVTAIRKTDKEPTWKAWMAFGRRVVAKSRFFNPENEISKAQIVSCQLDALHEYRTDHAPNFACPDCLTPFAFVYDLHIHRPRCGGASCIWLPAIRMGEASTLPPHLLMNDHATTSRSSIALDKNNPYFKVSSGRPLTGWRVAAEKAQAKKMTLEESKKKKLEKSEDE